MGKRYVYTPQVVVDGRAETVGSNRSNVNNLIRMAAAAQKIAIDVALHKDGTADIHVPAEAAQRRAELWIGFYDSACETTVRAGENRGETSVNGSIVRSFRRIGTWTGADLKKRVDLKASGATGRDGYVIVLQAADNGPIIGAASFPLMGGRS